MEQVQRAHATEVHHRVCSMNSVFAAENDHAIADCRASYAHIVTPLLPALFWNRARPTQVC